MTSAMAHLDEEQLAAFFDGHLDHEELERVATHIANCEECGGIIRETGEFEREEVARRTRQRNTWLTAAAVVVVVAGAAFPAWRYWEDREFGKAVQAVFVAETKPGRPAVGRFTGQMVYAKPAPNMRGGNEPGEPPDVPEDVQLAAYTLLGKVATDSSPRAVRARAIAHLALKDQPTEALQDVIHIPVHASRDAGSWNDVAAAQYSLAIREDRPDPLKSALDAADQALRIDKKMPEALFNRALILRRMNDPRAASAIADYLAIDSRSPWADELRPKLEPIQ